MRGLRRRGLSGGQRADGYRVLSVGQKQQAARERIAPRLALVRCADCMTGLFEHQLAAHLAERCSGSPVVGRTELTRKRPCRR